MAKIESDGLAIKLSEDEQKDAVNQAIKDINNALSERSEEESNWKKWETEQYLGDLGVKNFPWKNCSNVNSSMTMEAVNDTWSRIVNTVFPIRPYVRIKGRGSEDMEKASAVESYWDYLSQEMPLVPVSSLWILDIVKFGSGVVIEKWANEKNRVREWGKEKNKEGKETRNGKIEEKTQSGYIGPKVEKIELEDFIVPKSSKSLQYPDSRFNCRIYRLSLDEIKRKEKEGIFINVDVLLDKIKEKKADANKQFELYEYWGRFDADGDGLEENVVFTILKEEEILLRSTLFPYFHNKRPFVMPVFIPKKGSIYGLGLCEMLTHIHNTENTVFNQMIDNGSLVNSKMTKSLKGKHIEVKLHPGANIEVDDMNDIQAFELGDLHPSSFNLLTVCRMYFERVTKVTDFTSGRRSSTRKGQTTASEVMALIGESNKWFDLILKNFLMGYVEVLQQGTALLQQYMPSEVEFQKMVMGEEGEVPFTGKVSREHIAGNFDYIPQAKTVISQELEERKALMFFDIAMKLPFIQQQPALMKELTQDLFTTLGKKTIGEKLDEYYPTTPEQMMKVQERAKKENEAMAKMIKKMLPKTPPQPSMGENFPIIPR